MICVHFFCLLSPFCQQISIAVGLAGFACLMLVVLFLLLNKYGRHSKFGMKGKQPVYLLLVFLQICHVFSKTPSSCVKFSVNDKNAGTAKIASYCLAKSKDSYWVILWSSTWAPILCTDLLATVPDSNICVCVHKI